MFNNSIITQLLSSTGKTKKDFLNAVFTPQSKRSLSYFDKVEDINFSTAEKVADFFGVPMDCFRTTPHMNSGVAIGNHNQVGNFNLNTNLMAEITYLQKMLDAKNETIESFQKLLDTKEEIIAGLKKRLDDVIATKVGS